MKAASILFRIIAILLLGLGALAASFGLLYLAGAILTVGREYTGEMMVLLGIATVCLLAGVGAWLAANAMGRG